MAPGTVPGTVGEVVRKVSSEGVCAAILVGTFRASGMAICRCKWKPIRAGIGGWTRKAIRKRTAVATSGWTENAACGVTPMATAGLIGGVTAGG
jgi:hypothetical protein